MKRFQSNVCTNINILMVFLSKVKKKQREEVEVKFMNLLLIFDVLMIIAYEPFA